MQTDAVKANGRKGKDMEKECGTTMRCNFKGDNGECLSLSKCPQEKKIDPKDAELTAYRALGTPDEITAQLAELRKYKEAEEQGAAEKEANRCEKCGGAIDCVLVGVFNHDGSDGDIKIPITNAEESAVIIDTSQNWTGYELTEEEQRETITCPHCKEFPFKNEEIQVYNIVRIVCFKTADAAGDALEKRKGK